MITFTNIPQIDLSPLFKHETAGFLTVAQQVKTIYSEVGFTYITNHNVPQTIIDKAFHASEKFHALPLSTKNRIVHGKSYRGYMPNKSSISKLSGIEEATKPNESAAFIMLNEVDKNSLDYQNETNLAGPNLWPDNLPDFKEAILNYNTEMLTLATKLIRVFSLAFGLDVNDLDQYFTEPTTSLSLQYYPEQPEIIPDDQFGLAPHTDCGFLTILAQDSVAGLQVKNQANEWINVPPIPGSFVLNSGDMLRLMTNDTFLSTRHRVINKSREKRYSIPFFFDPNMHAKLAPLAIFCDDRHPAKYPTIEYCEHVMRRLRSNYDLGA